MNDELTFETRVTVKLGNKKVGEIKPERRPDGVYVYRYYPKGSTVGGEPFSTLQLCKQSLC